MIATALRFLNRPPSISVTLRPPRPPPTVGQALGTLVVHVCVPPRPYPARASAGRPSQSRFTPTGAPIVRCRHSSCHWAGAKFAVRCLLVTTQLALVTQDWCDVTCKHITIFQITTNSDFFRKNECQDRNQGILLHHSTYFSQGAIFPLTIYHLIARSAVVALL